MNTKTLITVMAVVAVITLAGCEQPNPMALTDKCPTDGREIIVVDASSSQRSSRHLDTVAEAVAASASRAAVCKRDWSGRAAAGGAAINLAPAPDLAALTGATEAGRRNNLALRAPDVRAHFRAELTRAFRQLPANTSSLPTLLTTAAEVTTPNSNIILLTDAVDQGTGTDLNRELAPGEGTATAQATTPIPNLSDTRVTIAGIAQMDRRHTTAPGTLWTTEITNYARTLCERTNANCRTLTAYDQTDLTN